MSLFGHLRNIVLTVWIRHPLSCTHTAVEHYEYEEHAVKDMSEELDETFGPDGGPKHWADPRFEAAFYKN